MVATPTGTPIPIAISSDVFKPPEDTLPLSLEGTVALDEVSIEACELVMGLVVA